MNTVTRTYSGAYAVRKASGHYFTLRQCLFSLLFLGLLVSSFAVVYAKYLNRNTFAQYQVLKKQTQHYRVQWSKLLLEAGALSTQSRVQQLARKQLDMVIPNSHHIVFIRKEFGGRETH